MRLNAQITVSLIAFKRNGHCDWMQDMQRLLWLNTMIIFFLKLVWMGFLIRNIDVFQVSVSVLVHSPLLFLLPGTTLSSPIHPIFQINTLGKILYNTLLYLYSLFWVCLSEGCDFTHGFTSSPKLQCGLVLSGLKIWVRGLLSNLSKPREPQICS